MQAFGQKHSIFQYIMWVPLAFTVAACGSEVEPAIGADVILGDEPLTNSGKVLDTTSSMCVWGRSEISTDAVWLRSISEVDTYKACAGTPWPELTLPAGYLTTRTDLLYWNGSAWTTCRSTGWIASTTTAARNSIVAAYGTLKPCGSGYYGNQSGLFAWDGSAWRGNYYYSGNLYVP